MSDDVNLNCLAPLSCNNPDDDQFDFGSCDRGWTAQGSHCSIDGTTQCEPGSHCVPNGVRGGGTCEILPVFAGLGERCINQDDLDHTLQPVRCGDGLGCLITDEFQGRFNETGPQAGGLCVLQSELNSTLSSGLMVHQSLAGQFCGGNGTYAPACGSGLTYNPANIASEFGGFCVNTTAT
ncbi:hypothetical protein BDK51DRAFT_25634 [Blyttiomyces helicus]|uniref:IGFBP N-terminal domain-containing protein n=1 Tax=Blyttiomyces helicus TaxID=388810 RepID=A0A4P9W257_9FUNG|nr:hypothetical protein BDK51DRAFT_25634 [Blyttiomyces helicus]|eukprot:RKO86291.1 hypothetical protein BDK51DRAFT_25634 [Blyttiomyces helicus]